ncbi:MAG: two-component regulator propeller domain-containing protein [Bacteroidales bacterium]
MLTYSNAVCNNQKLFDNTAGLSNSLINSISQDDNTFIWIATEDGLNRFDGKTFKKYYPSIDSRNAGSSFITRTYIDSDGTLWAGTINALLKYSPEEDILKTVYSFVQTPTPPFISDIIEGNNNELWIATSNYGIIRYLKDQQQFDFLPSLNNQIDTKNILRLRLDHNHTLWIGTADKGLYSYDLESLKIDQLLKTSQSEISAIAILKNKIYATSMSNGIFIYDTTTKITEQVATQQQRAFKTIYIDSRDCIWVGSDGDGLYLLDKATKKVSRTEHQSTHFDFSKSKIHSITEDRAGNIWIGIFQKGLLLLDESKSAFQNFGYNTLNSELNIGSSCVTAIAQNDDFIWFGTDGDGIYQVNKANKQIKHISLQEIAGSNVLCLYYKDSKLWIGGFLDGLIAYDLKTGRASKQNPPGQSIEKITSIIEYNNSLLLGTLGSKIYQYNITNHTFSLLSFVSKDINKRIPKYINDILIDNEGNIWIASYDGVFCISKSLESIQMYNTSTNSLLPSNLIYCIFQHRDGDIWIGTHNGLLNLSTNKVYTTSSGLGSNVICSIESDIYNNIWVGTHNGLSYLKDTEEAFNTFYREDNIQSNEFYKKSSLSGGDSILFFGGINGATQINSNHLNYAPNLNKVILTNFHILSDSVEKDVSLIASDSIQIKEDQGSFVIHFTSDAIANQSKISYSYQLEGINHDWISPIDNANYATYTNIPYGTYTFFVKAHYKGIDTKLKQLHITILPPWYKTNLAKALWLLLLIGLLFIIYSLQRERLIRQEMEINNETKMRFFINIANEIKKPLGLVIDPLNELINNRRSDKNYRLYQIMYSNAHRILRLADQILDIRKIEKEEFALIFKECNILDYITELSAYFSMIFLEKKIRFKIDCSQKDISVWIDTNNFEKVIFNILSNAVRHTPYEGAITITIKKMKTITIDVFNSGSSIPKDEIEKIFNRFYQVKEGSSKGTGMGLDLAKSIVNLHHGKIWANNNNNGVSLIISLPVGKEHIKSENTSLEPIELPNYKIPDIQNLSTKTSNLLEENVSNIDIIIIDNDIRTSDYLKETLRYDFNIINFTNTTDAIKHIDQTEPSLIICNADTKDLNGFEMCSRIKHGIKTSHIPVIITASQTDEETRERSIIYGADSFMTKPLYSHNLKEKVNNIIENRRRIYQNAINRSTTNIDYSVLNLKPKDEEILEKVTQYIENNLSEQNLTVDIIAKEIGMSRVQLYRKLKETTNISASDFIRNTKMKYAAEILKTKKISVSELAYKLGYSSPSYFSKSFKAYYGVSPKTYTQNRGSIIL